MNWKRNLLNLAIGSAVLVGGLTLASVPAKADACSKVREERIELSRASARYGYWSPQAQRERRDLSNAEAACYGYGYRNGGYYGYGNPGYSPYYRDRDDWRYRDRDDRYVYRDRDDRRGRDNDDRGRHRGWDRDDHDRGRGHDKDHDRDHDRH